MPGLLKFFDVSDRSNHFDLPFHARLGTEFLVFLTGLMTVLCLLSATASLSLTQLAERWTAGLENTLTVEIPASETQNQTALKILGALKDAQGIKSAKLMDREDMDKLLAPWLGSAAGEMKDLPVPSLITIELKSRDERILKGITRMVQDISTTAHIDAHEAWLTDLVRMTNVLKFAALLVMLAIGLVTSLTVAGAVRSRMAIHHGELELLHIMGADDKYISGQFQKYIYVLCGKGVLTGFIICALVVGGLQIASMTANGTLPGLSLSPLQFLCLPLLAVALILISGWTARLTALKVLRAMP